MPQKREQAGDFRTSASSCSESQVVRATRVPCDGTALVTVGRPCGMNAALLPR